MLSRCLSVLLMAALLVANAQAASGRLKPQAGKPISQQHLAKQQAKSLARQKRKVASLRKQMNGMASVVRDMQQRGVGNLMTDPQVQARLTRAVNAYGNAKKQLNEMKKESLHTYAQRRGLNYIPDPPATAPPPLPATPAPGTRLELPQPQAMASKSFRPLSQEPRLSVRPDVNF